MGNSEEIRKIQIQIMTELQKYKHLPIIIGGDFNDTHEENYTKFRWNAYKNASYPITDVSIREILNMVLLILKL